MLVPLYGFLEGDTIGLLVLVDDQEKVGVIASKLQDSAGVRVAPRAGLEVWHGGKPLDPELLVGAAGLTALDRVDVRQGGGGHGV